MEQRLYQSQMAKANPTQKNGGHRGQEAKGKT
jgi:hypothetical protein